MGLVCMQLLLKLNKIITSSCKRMNSTQKGFRLFCADDSPVHPTNYIFDKTYKNMSQKKRFERDPKFAYFNTLIKLKNNYKQTNKDVYSYIFKPQDISKQEENEQRIPTRQIFTRAFAPRRTFHVEKINNHAFKIYKDKRKDKYSTHNLSQNNVESIKDIDFRVHFKSINRQQQEKPKFELLLSEYKKLHEMKAKTNPEKNVDSRVRKGSVRHNLTQKTESVVPRKNLSVNSASRFITTAKSKARSNMSQLAFKISN